MSDNFYFNTDQNKYVPIKTNLNILHKNDIDTSNKSNNKIGLIYNTDTNSYEYKSIPKHIKIIKDINDISNLNSKPKQDLTCDGLDCEGSTSDFDTSERLIPSSETVSSYSSNNYNLLKKFSKPISENLNESQSINESVNNSYSSDNSNPFKQSSKYSSYSSDNSNPFKQSSKDSYLEHCGF